MNSVIDVSVFLCVTLLQGIGLHFDHPELKQIIMPKGDVDSPLPPVTTVFSASNYCGRDGNTGAVLQFHVGKEGKDGKGNNNVDILRFAPVTDQIIDAFVEAGKREEDQEREKDHGKMPPSLPSNAMAAPSLTSSPSWSEPRMKSGRSRSSLDSVHMTTFSAAAKMLSFMGLHQIDILCTHVQLYEQYKVQETGETRSHLHSKQLWHWAKAKLHENSCGRFKQHHKFQGTLLKSMVLKTTKKKATGARSSNELKPSFREKELSTTFGSHDRSVLSAVEVKAVHLCYDMWDLSSSCEITENDLDTFYTDMEGAGGGTSTGTCCEMVDVVRVLAADSFHITAADFLRFAVVMKEKHMARGKEVEEVEGSSGGGGGGGGEGEGGSGTMGEEAPEELQTTSVFDGWEVGWSVAENSFFYVKDGVSQWDKPEAKLLQNWEAVLDPTSKQVYCYSLMDETTYWDFEDVFRDEEVVL